MVFALLASVLSLSQETCSSSRRVFPPDPLKSLRGPEPTVLSGDQLIYIAFWSWTSFIRVDKITTVHFLIHPIKSLMPGIKQNEIFILSLTRVLG